ncbi:uncharacterized protein LOC131947746 [Physella acuta]|uniref:uncharacterized protein LOC131947746 n=1 Tax=Physella acuta TaxID=109671 RepID=UPI0027DB4BF9|nr:uncharacterized protein LOC131947746 [Physella acuta]XP_059165017.1 uncharacterized protein LOC131947746 [Physella acuta]XP_059165018.1 uncharacterized protein LOC131947746 [Physella acuta]XP_059165019.1 uncharacterized protein LOC131947746 [Physella acuta]
MACWVNNLMCNPNITNIDLSVKHFFLITKRFKKHFASLHNLDRKMYIFPNTTSSLVNIPLGTKVCKTLTDFKIKTLFGGFQRRPELISKLEPNLENNYFNFPGKGNNLEQTYRFEKTKTIQQELVSMALKFSDSVVNSGNNNQEPRPKKCILDIGCGNGLSMIQPLSLGHVCIGVDLNLQSLSDFKSVYLENVESCEYLDQAADLLRCDLRYGLPFKAGSFDLVISISFLQWLFHGDSQTQLNLFFRSLRHVLQPNGRAVLQFYPSCRSQLEEAVNFAVKYFHGVLLGDYPHLDRGRKLFLILF